MKFVRVLKASEDWKVLRRHHDTENGEDYYYIWGPDGEYCDADGNPYHFDTREDALEEVEYLKAEHKFDKKADKSQLDYNIAFNAIQTAIDNDLITDPETEFDDVSYELLEEANLNPDDLTDEEYNYWKNIFLEVWKNVDWNY